MKKKYVEESTRELRKAIEHSVSPNAMYLLRLTELCLKTRWYETLFIMGGAKLRYLPKSQIDPADENSGMTREIEIRGHAMWVAEKSYSKHDYTARFEMVTDHTRFFMRWYPRSLKLYCCRSSGEGVISPDFGFVREELAVDDETAAPILELVKMMRTEFSPA